MNLHELFNMSGYGPYVWSCYGLTLAVLVGLGVNARRQLQSEVVRANRRVPTAKVPMAEHKS
jgi:heme exporter protein CcmD